MAWLAFFVSFLTEKAERRGDGVTEMGGASKGEGDCIHMRRIFFFFFFHIIILGSRALCLWEPRKLTTRSVPLVVAQVLLICCTACIFFWVL